MSASAYATGIEVIAIVLVGAAVLVVALILVLLFLDEV